VFAGVVDVRPLVWWEEDMAGRGEQDLLAVVAFGEVETPGTLSMRCGLGSDGDPKCKSKRIANVDGWVRVPNGFGEVWTDRPGVDGLPAFGFNVGDVELLEKF
jgi:hypothetical protein